MEQLLILITVLTPIITAVTALLKTLIPESKSKWVALLALVVGVACGALWYPLAPEFTLIQALWAGGLAGLAAGGFYSVQNVRNKE